MLLNYGHSVIVSTYNYLTYYWLMKKILKEKLKKNNIKKDAQLVHKAKYDYGNTW